jgi:hypothetical protein
VIVRLIPAALVLEALIACGLALCCANAWGGDAQVRLGFVTNFARYTEWPTQKWTNANAPLTVCLLAGDKDMSADLASVEKHTISGRTVRGVQLSKLQDIEQCGVLFVPIEYKLPMKPVMEAADKYKILTVSDRVDFIEEGGMIGLAPSSGRYVFDVNLIAARAAELKLSSQLLKLARTVK